MELELRRNESTFFERVYLQQFEDTVRYLRLKYSASHADAYDAVMDTIITFRKRFIDGKIKYGNLRYLFLQMASQHYIKSRNTGHHLDITDMELAAPDHDIDEASFEFFQTAWELASPSCKEILTQHYYLNQKLTDIAEMTQQPTVNVRKQKERCLNKLRQFILTLRNK